MGWWWGGGGGGGVGWGGVGVAKAGCEQGGAALRLVTCGAHTTYGSCWLLGVHHFNCPLFELTEALTVPVPPTQPAPASPSSHTTPPPRAPPNDFTS